MSEWKERGLIKKNFRQGGFEEEDERQEISAPKKARKKLYKLEYFVPIPKRFQKSNGGIITLDEFNLRSGYYNTWCRWGKYETEECATKAAMSIARRMGYKMRLVYEGKILWDKTKEQLLGEDPNGEAGQL